MCANSTAGPQLSQRMGSSPMAVQCLCDKQWIGAKCDVCPPGISLTPSALNPSQDCTECKLGYEWLDANDFKAGCVRPCERNNSCPSETETERPSSGAPATTASPQPAKGNVTDPAPPSLRTALQQSTKNTADAGQATAAIVISAAPVAGMGAAASLSVLNAFHRMAVCAGKRHEVRRKG